MPLVLAFKNAEYISHLLLMSVSVFEKFLNKCELTAWVCLLFSLQNTRVIATGTGPPRYRVLMSDGVYTLSCEYDKLQ